MKEASGELNMTAITIVAIAAIAAFFYAFVWPALKNNITRSQQCASAICEECKSGLAKCSYVDDKGAVKPLDCPCKG